MDPRILREREERMAKAIYLAYVNIPEARWESVDPHYKETVWVPAARVALERCA